MEYDNKKSGFSLAETMVALVIVALVLAAAAPLVAKKMTNDAKRYLFASGNNVFAAAGVRQVLNVGSGSELDNVKLNVNGGANIQGNLTVNNKDDDNNNVTMILAADGIRKGTDDGDVLFQIDPDTRETNIEIAIPDYTQMSSGSNTLTKAPSNGFVYISNATRGYTISTCAGGEPDPTGNYKGNINFTVRQESADSDSDGNNDTVSVSVLPMIIPISKGQCYICNNNAVTVGGTTFNDANYDNQCYFIPLKHAVAEEIPAS